MSWNEFDMHTCYRLNRLNSWRGVGRMFAIVSRLGDGMLWYWLWAGIIMLNGWHGFQAAVVMATAGIICTTTYKLIKHSTARPRPFTVHHGMHLTVQPLDKFSFPSGHTLHAVCFTILAIAYAPVLAWFLIPFSVLVAASRMVLGLHYPSDVLAGATIGAIIGSCAIPFLPI